MQVAECFTGIAGFRRGFEAAQMKTTVMIEWDKACRTILSEHYPDTPLLEDIKDVHGTDIGRPDLIVGGFPCQDTSIAAPHRAGLAGTRSGHFNEFTRLVGEYAQLVDATNPRWVVIENPTGLLKSNGGRDMGTVLGHLVDLGYGVAYRVVDGGHPGTPQRRPRVVVVGHRGGDPRPAWQVLGDRAPGGEAAREDHDGRQESGPDTRPIPGGDSLVRVWRKGARPRVALSKGYEGGYRETWVNDGKGNTLTGFDGGLATRQTHLIAQNGRLRTLTLTEWERLMGFPDGWTAMVKDGPRYTALGNAMHVGTATWLGHRLQAVHAALPQIEQKAS